jgi:hypothetical protein
VTGSGTTNSSSIKELISQFSLGKQSSTNNSNSEEIRFYKKIISKPEFMFLTAVEQLLQWFMYNSIQKVR